MEANLHIRGIPSHGVPIASLIHRTSFLHFCISVFLVHIPLHSAVN